jgi:Protein of unknown function (DUF1553)/Protein of unknown function (DUF1549)
MSSIWLCAIALICASPQDSIDFDTQIIPVLTKSGCNAGACHGAAAGRGGLRFSLLGANPDSDYEAIVQALEGRRVNLAKPETSLLYRKPTGQLEHGGDILFEDDEAGAELLLTWLRSGAPRGVSRKLTELKITPERQLCHVPGTPIPLKASARFDNQPAQDVTDWTVFSPIDPTAIQIEDNHVARVLRRGQHTIVARFLNQVISIQISVPFSDKSHDLTKEPRANLIDAEVLRVLSELQLPVSPPAADTAWLRRISLDLTGRLPEPSLIDSFQADKSDDKRIRTVDSLLASDAFNDYWTLRFAKLLRIHSLPNEPESLTAYAVWLRNGISNGTGFDKLARELLTATGDTHLVGAANFGRMVGDPRAHAELVGSVFMGVQLGCANCHNHPLDKWTQDDFHGLAAVFAKLERGRNVQISARGSVTNLRTGEPAKPRIPATRDLGEEGDHREAVFEWLVAPEKNYFARATVNRLWRAMFGRGLVEPTDDLRDTNLATHPELLERLAEDFVNQGFDIRHTLRLIALSHTYARSEAIAGNELDDRFYSHVMRRPLEPEVLVDAISDVTGVAESFPGQNSVRAVNMIDPAAPAPVLERLGRCQRANGCPENMEAGDGGLPAQLQLLNGDIINRKLTDPAGRLRQLIDHHADDARIVDEFFVRGLGRHPTTEELKGWLDRLKTENAEERRKRLEDFVWSLLNSRQFRENH